MAQESTGLPGGKAMEGDDFAGRLPHHLNAGTRPNLKPGAVGGMWRPPAFGKATGVTDFLDRARLKHVFDQRQALWNLADRVAVGGQAVRAMQANILDHGFCNYSSTLLADFYRQTGWPQVYLHNLATPMAETGQDTLDLKIAPGAPNGGFWFGLSGRFRQLEEAGRLILAQGLYEALHDA